MNRLKAAAMELAETVSLSEGIAPGASKVTLTGTKRLVIESHRGILSYGSEHIAAAARSGKIHVYGTALRLMAMSSETLIIGGNINSVEFE